MPKKKMHFILLLTSIFASIVFLSGCVEEVYVDELKRPDTEVRFMQADPNYGPITFSIYGRFEDSTKVIATETVDFTSASGYFTVPSGERKVTIQGNGINATATVTFTSYWQTTLTLRAGALSNSYERFTYSDEAYKIDSGRGTKGAIRFRNLLADAAVSCVLDDQYFLGSNTARAIGSSTGYVAIETGEHNFWIFTGTSGSATFNFVKEIDFNVAGNVRYTIAAFGTSDEPVLKIFNDDGK